VDSLQFKQERPDESRSRRDFDSGCLLGCLTVTRTVYVPSYPSDPFGEERHLTVGEGTVA
jgi:hypothetical protein